MASMDIGFDLDQEQRQRNLPRLIEANYLLHLSSQELETVIATEMASNPALEIDERPICHVCGHPLEGRACPTCHTPNGAQQATRIVDEVERYEPIAPSRLTTPDEDFDEVLLIAEDLDTLGHLFADVRAALPQHDHAIAEYLINTIDERGLLSSTPTEIAKAARVPERRVLAVLETIQSLAPAGVGARDLRESLMLQLDFLEDDGLQVPPLVRAIIRDHLAELGAHRYHNLARQLRAPVEDVATAHDFIKSQLSPHPLQDVQVRTWQRSATTPYVVPDVLISIDEEELQVEVIGHRQERLRVNDLYDGLAQQLRRRPISLNGSAPTRTAAAVLDASEEDRQHIRESVIRARQFISKLQQRRETLLKISVCICEMQKDFLRDGIRELRPLTRSEVALQVGVHESTVSRATANKYVMLPNRKVIPFSHFFTPSLGIKDVIKELIEQESAKGEPLSDMRIRDLLMDRGYRIARRTVAKYRAELRILPSTVR